MANISIPNLCGSNQAFSDIQSQIEKITGELVSGLESEASSLASTLTAEANFLESKLRALVPQAPELPNVNLQAEITSLVSIDRGTAAGNDKYLAALALITTKFGSALTASGFSLDTLVTNSLATIAGGNNLCDLVPNFEALADGSGEAFEKAKESLQPTIDAVKEEVSKLNKNTNLTEAKSIAATSFDAYTSDTPTVPPTEDTGAYVVSEKSTEVSYAGGAKIKVTTASDAVTITTVSGGGSTVARANVSSKGFPYRKRFENLVYGYSGIDYKEVFKSQSRATAYNKSQVEITTSAFIESSGAKVVKIILPQIPVQIKYIRAARGFEGVKEGALKYERKLIRNFDHEDAFEDTFFIDGVLQPDYVPFNVVEIHDLPSQFSADNFGRFIVSYKYFDTIDPNFAEGP